MSLTEVEMKAINPLYSEATTGREATSANKKEVERCVLERTVVGRALLKPSEQVPRSARRQAMLFSLALLCFVLGGGAMSAVRLNNENDDKKTYLLTFVVLVFAGCYVVSRTRYVYSSMLLGVGMSWFLATAGAFLKLQKPHDVDFVVGDSITYTFTPVWMFFAVLFLKPDDAILLSLVDGITTLFLPGFSETSFEGCRKLFAFHAIGLLAVLVASAVRSSGSRNDGQGCCQSLLSKLDYVFLAPHSSLETGADRSRARQLSVLLLCTVPPSLAWVGVQEGAWVDGLDEGHDRYKVIAFVILAGLTTLYFLSRSKFTRQVAFAFCCIMFIAPYAMAISTNQEDASELKLLNLISVTVTATVGIKLLSQPFLLIFSIIFLIPLAYSPIFQPHIVFCVFFFVVAVVDFLDARLTSKKEAVQGGRLGWTDNEAAGSNDGDLKAQVPPSERRLRIAARILAVGVMLGLGFAAIGSSYNALQTFTSEYDDAQGQSVTVEEEPEPPAEEFAQSCFAAAGLFPTVEPSQDGLKLSIKFTDFRRREMLPADDGADSEDAVPSFSFLSFQHDDTTITATTAQALLGESEKWPDEMLDSLSALREGAGSNLFGAVAATPAQAWTVGSGRPRTVGPCDDDVASGEAYDWRMTRSWASFAATMEGTPALSCVRDEGNSSSTTPSGPVRCSLQFALILVEKAGGDNITLVDARTFTTMLFLRNNGTEIAKVEQLGKSGSEDDDAGVVISGDHGTGGRRLIITTNGFVGNKVSDPRCSLRTGCKVSKERSTFYRMDQWVWGKVSGKSVTPESAVLDYADAMQDCKAGTNVGMPSFKKGVGFGTWSRSTKACEDMAARAFVQRRPKASIKQAQEYANAKLAIHDSVECACVTGTDAYWTDRARPERSSNGVKVPSWLGSAKCLPGPCSGNRFMDGASGPDFPYSRCTCGGNFVQEARPKNLLTLQITSGECNSKLTMKVLITGSLGQYTYRMKTPIGSNKVVRKVLRSSYYIGEPKGLQVSFGDGSYYPLRKDSCEVIRISVKDHVSGKVQTAGDATKQSIVTSHHGLTARRSIYSRSNRKRSLLSGREELHADEDATLDDRKLQFSRFSAAAGMRGYYQTKAAAKAKSIVAKKVAEKKKSFTLYRSPLLTVMPALVLSTGRPTKRLDPIYDITAVYYNRNCPSGYDKIKSYQQNEGTDGHKVNLCVKRSKYNTVNSLLIRTASGTSWPSCPNGYLTVTDHHSCSGNSCTKADFNHGAVRWDGSRRRIILCFRRGASNPIYQLRTIEGRWEDPPPGFYKISTDLNKGVGGDYVYLTYSRKDTMKAAAVALSNNDNPEDTNDWMSVKEFSDEMRLEVTMRLDCQKEDGPGWSCTGEEYISYSEFQRICSLLRDGIEDFWSRRPLTLNGITHDVVIKTIETSSSPNKDVDICVWGNYGDYSSDSPPRSVNMDWGIWDMTVWLNRGSFGSTSTQIGYSELNFKETAAHELGHSILYAQAGRKHSWSHKGTSTQLGGKVDDQPACPSTGDIDIMKYYDNNGYMCPGSYSQFGRVKPVNWDVAKMIMTAGSYSQIE